MTRTGSTLIRATLLCAALGIAMTAVAKLHKARLGLTPTQTSCDAGKANYKYVATWKASTTGVTYRVYTGNQCKVGTCATGTATSQGCPATCTATGSCSAALQGCLTSTQAQWVKVLGSDDGYEQVTAPAPGKCL
jgi:hypothetical protein